MNDIEFDDFMDFDDSDFIFSDIEIDETPKDENIQEAENIQIAREKPKQRRSTVIKRPNVGIYRRAYSETQLLDLVTEEMKVGYSYHFITGGDVDSLSYLKLILRQQNLDYCLFSTWCMAQEDVHQFKDWIESGKIKKVDAYVGEIFPSSYQIEYSLLKPLVESTGGRICIFRNHAKIYAGYGERFYFGIQTSANINTNPRTENGCITIGREIFEFYKDYFDKVVSFI